MELTNELCEALETISHNGRWKNGTYEVFISVNCKHVQIGTFKNDTDGYKALFNYRCNKIIETIISLGLDGLQYRVYDNRYIVFENGIILNLYGREMMGGIDYSGYREVLLNGKFERVHRIVASCFVEKPYGKDCVNHKDGNKLNNNAWNLEWVTHSENTLHAFSIGLQKAGEAVNTAKLTEDDVRYIRENYKPRDPVYGRIPLSKKFGVSIDAITDAANYNTWRYLDD